MLNSVYSSTISNKKLLRGESTIADEKIPEIPEVPKVKEEVVVKVGDINLLEL